jgi:hypothetical protein
MPWLWREEAAVCPAVYGAATFGFGEHKGQNALNARISAVRPSRKWGCYGVARLLWPGVRDEVVGRVGAGRAGWDRWRS